MSASRSVTINVVNKSNADAIIASANLSSGVWVISPTDVSSGQTKTFECDSDGFMTGAVGSITYQMGNSGSMVGLGFDDPFAGGNSFSANGSGNYAASYTVNVPGDNCTVTYTISNQ